MSGASRDKARQLKTLMKRPQGIPSVGVHDALSALVAQQAGLNSSFWVALASVPRALVCPTCNFLACETWSKPSAS